LLFLRLGLADDQFAIPDDNDALGRGTLLDGFSIGGLLDGSRRASDYNDSVVAFCLVHGGPNSGDGQL
jgi:hypothetical protein